MKKESLSSSDFKDIFFKIFYSFKEYNGEGFTEKFLKTINERYIKLKQIEPKTFHIAFYTNISVLEKYKCFWNSLLDDFNINSLKYSDLEIPSNHSYGSFEAFKTNNEILKVEIKSKSFVSAFNESKRKFNVLFGFLVFLNKYNKISNKWHINDLALNYSESYIKIVSYIILNEKWFRRRI